MERSSRPTNKVSAGALAGAASAIIVWAVRQFAKVEVPAEIAMAASVVITFAVQWSVTDEPAQGDGPQQ